MAHSPSAKGALPVLFILISIIVGAVAPPVGGGGSAPTPIATPTPTASPVGGSFGDPHIRTFGGMIVTYTGEGDVTMLEARSIGLRYQNRFHSPVESPASWTTAASLQCSAGAEVLEVYAMANVKQDANIMIDKQPMKWLEVGDQYSGTSVQVQRTQGGKYVFACLNDALRLKISIHRHQEEYGWMDVLVYPGAQLHSQAVGLLGSYDNNHDNDVAFSHGEVVKLSDKDKAEKYVSAVDNGAIREVEESWRVSSANSLFSEVHPMSQSKLGSNRRVLSLPALADPVRMERARKLCMEGGLLGAFLHTCAYDLSVTGDESHILRHLEAMEL
eukprot:CAMPEP_0184348790 /NCGR_PEP_ID=MMETSP1089-20130417/30441_1 /TAXON_ID=38269 ORGANISM="Gloeochaete wittrockiana, Strain SAG46.84" /NCGR_SAMPLE_ID=MMETSP1089 /ASSEMBLY_ACC=CAM_ASM_000445 /LENGTH=329 /DNA_ID=CAMNT_0026680707 /DNA_START=160 /DNA_END=1149 /DNA_ORIENTATION=-